jgi:hypothetical protein
MIAAIESRFMANNPGQKLYLSRRWIQKQAMDIRFMDLISGKRDQIAESGWPIDVVQIIKEKGLLQYSDASDDSVGGIDYADLRARLLKKLNQNKQGNKVKETKALAKLLSEILYSKFPARTKVRSSGKVMNRHEFAHHVLADEWISVVPSDLNEGQTGTHPHIEPDLRSTTPSALYISRDAAYESILKSLKLNSAVAYCTKLHCVMIHGAVLDQNGQVLAFKIQDSNFYFEDNISGRGTMTYLADPETVKNELVDVTLIQQATM